jgi:hypothetical protein
LAVGHSLFAEESTFNWTFPGWDAERDRNLRAEILYGLLGMHPEFFADEPYLRLIARRRYRIVQRMLFFVDPNHETEDEGNVFVYPIWRLWLRAQPQSTPTYWEKQDGHYPFVLTDAGKSDPKSAIEAPSRSIHPQGQSSAIGLAVRRSL